MILTDDDIRSIQRALANESEVSVRPITYTVKAVRHESAWLVLTLGRAGAFAGSEGSNQPAHPGPRAAASPHWQ